jgi:amino acid transporter
MCDISVQSKSVSYSLVDIRIFTLTILALFALITVAGIGESSYVTLAMFMLHMCVLTLLIVWGFGYGVQDCFRTLIDNMHSPFPNVSSTNGKMLSKHNALGSLYFGFCSALLGITGFETAANYVEQMHSSRTFIKTVNWMW